MSPSRRQRSRSAAAFAVFLAATLTVIGFTGIAGADKEQKGEGSAFGLSSEGILDIDPVPLAEFPPGETETEIEVDLSPLVLACVLNAESDGKSGSNGFVESSASAADVTLLGEATCGDEDDDGDGLLGGLLGDGLLGGDDGDDASDLGDLLDDLLGDDLLDLDGGIFVEAVTSECRADGDGVEGDSEVIGLEEDTLLSLNGLDLDLGILEVAIGEEIVDEDENSIIVRGLRVTVLPDGGLLTDDDEPLLEVIVAESRCQFDLKPKAETTTTTDKPGAGSTTSTTKKPATATTTTVKPATTTTVTPTADASNNAEVSNDSDGTASIETGDAIATGNDSVTDIDQSAQGGDADQSARVRNSGDAVANTGDNVAVGNESTNVASNEQVASSRTRTRGADGTASNDATTSNSSDGSAEVVTGDADALGNFSDTTVNQDAEGGYYCDDNGENCQPCDEENECWGCDEDKRCNPCDDDDPCTGCDKGTCDCDCDDPWGSVARGRGSDSSQSANVTNSGTASANTGGNTAVGNASSNTATNDQTARSRTRR